MNKPFPAYIQPIEDPVINLEANYVIRQRHIRLVNTDPQRRCYDGCYISSEWQWTSWEPLESGLPGSRIAARLEFWRGLNAYAVKERGKSATTQYMAVEQVEQPA